MNHISIEGMDGVGKTTTCKKLAEKLGYQFVEKPLHYLFDDVDETIKYQEIAKKVNDNPNRNFTSMFYGLGSIYMYEMFKDQNIITDRHLASNYAWSGSEYNKDIYDLLVNKLGKPKMTIILYAPKEIIIARLRQRDINDKDIYRVEKSEKIYDRMVYFCRQYQFPYRLINTSNMTTDETVEKIIMELQK